MSSAAASATSAQSSFQLLTDHAKAGNALAQAGLAIHFSQYSNLEQLGLPLSQILCVPEEEADLRAQQIACNILAQVLGMQEARPRFKKVEDGDALCRRGLLEEDPVLRLAAIREATLNGSMDAQFYLGIHHRYGIQMAKNIGKAYAAWEEAASAGHIDASYYLATLLEQGHGPTIPQDMKRALELYAKAALGGNLDAMYALGRLAEERKCWDVAGYWFERASMHDPMLAVRKQVSPSALFWGRLAKEMPYGELIPFREKIQKEIEPELLFRLGQRFEQGKDYVYPERGMPFWKMEALAEHESWALRHFYLTQPSKHTIDWLVKPDQLKDLPPEDKSVFNALLITAAAGDVNAMRSFADPFFARAHATQSSSDCYQPYRNGAYYWLKRASAAGDSEANVLLAKLHLQGSLALREAAAAGPAAIDTQTVKKLLREAVAAGNAEAMLLLADVYEKEATESGIKQAKTLRTKAVQQKGRSIERLPLKDGAVSLDAIKELAALVGQGDVAASLAFEDVCRHCEFISPGRNMQMALSLYRPLAAQYATQAASIKQQLSREHVAKLMASPVIPKSDYDRKLQIFENTLKDQLGHRCPPDTKPFVQITSTSPDGVTVEVPMPFVSFNLGRGLTSSFPLVSTQLPEELRAEWSRRNPPRPRPVMDPFAILRALSGRP